MPSSPLNPLTRSRGTGEYYLSHARADRAVALAEEALAMTASVGAPDQARGMASYNLACARAGAGLLDEAAAAVAEAIALNPDVRANAATDPDLALLRDSGRLLIQQPAH